MGCDSTTPLLGQQWQKLFATKRAPRIGLPGRPDICGGERSPGKVKAFLNRRLADEDDLFSAEVD
jgi:hypothetical protein